MIIANSLEELTNTVYLASDTVVHGAMSDDDSGWKFRLLGIMSLTILRPMKLKLYNITDLTINNPTPEIEWKL